MKWPESVVQLFIRFWISLSGAVFKNRTELRCNRYVMPNRRPRTIFHKPDFENNSDELNLLVLTGSLES